jgi:hypothetical protein
MPVGALGKLRLSFPSFWTALIVRIRILGTYLFLQSVGLGGTRMWYLLTPKFTMRDSVAIYRVYCRERSNV